MPFTQRHLLGLEGLPAEEILHVLDTAKSFVEISERDIKKVPTLRGKTVINLFYESSTRTRTSFEIAAKRLSADTINISASTSSTQKGETLADTARNLEATRQALDARACVQAVNAILKAQRIYVIGYGASSWLGGLLTRNLDRYCENVQLLASIESSSYVARMLSRLKARDLVIAIAFPRYFSDTVLLARRVHEAGVRHVWSSDCVPHASNAVSVVPLFVGALQGHP